VSTHKVLCQKSAAVRVKKLQFCCYFLTYDATVIRLEASVLTSVHVDIQLDELQPCRSWGSCTDSECTSCLEVAAAQATPNTSSTLQSSLPISETKAMS